eukprot:CAMPEP_0194437384 /NCGR_PEP_ID=MMETSP0176-20130528/99703_1 /TAXON_ID=216777 /ORGANISM="Proboscia alata, Strain PI-D3" /LENGTH=37 /DNA_ID= /DNA_START= /DNA_END= /DNA_ORIENTATION=
MPWYFYILSIIAPFTCLAVGEAVKTVDLRHATRAEML